MPSSAADGARGPEARGGGSDPPRTALTLALVGHGRMGREIERLAPSLGHEIAAILHPSAEREEDRAISSASLRGAEVALEFTKPAAAVGNIRALARAGCRRIVVGTTGWKEALAEVEGIVAAHGLGLVHADNFSLGMALFARLVRSAAGLLAGRAGYDPCLVEWHHRGKRDAPSGTARLLAAEIESAAPGLVRHAGEAPAGGLPEGTFHVASVRAGAIPGTHLVGFESEADSIELRHTARGRAGFALGAIRAAEWVRGRAGLFTLEDVLEDLP